MFTSVIGGVPDGLEVDSTASRPTVTIPLAVSGDGYQLVAAEVRLWPHAWNGYHCHELKFCIVVYDERTAEPAVIFDRNMAQGYLEDVKDHVMPCVTHAAGLLVQAVQPDVIYRATYVTAPPEKALHKHQMITDTLVGSGYAELQTGIDQNRRQYWVMGKIKDLGDG